MINRGPTLERFILRIFQATNHRFEQFSTMMNKYVSNNVVEIRRNIFLSHC